MRRLAVLCGAWLSLCPWGALQAQEGALPTGEGPPSEGTPNEQEAQRLYQIGQLQFEGKEFAQSAKTFARAFELDPNPTLAYNAARAFENSGDLDGAARYYKLALGAEPEPELKRQCENALLRLDSIQKSRSSEEGVLAVEAQPRAEVTVNGEPRGQTPLELRLVPGDYELRLSQEGHQPQVRSIRVSPGATSAISAQLQPSSLTWVGWTGLGLVGVGLGVGGGAFYFQGEAEERYAQAQTSLDAQRDPARFEALEQEAGDLQGTANLMLWMGGATVVLGSGLFVLDWFGLFEGDERVFDGLVGASWWVSPGGAGVRGSF